MLLGKEKDFIKCMWKIVLNYECGYMLLESFVIIILLVCMINGVYKLIIICNDLFGYVEDILIIYLKINYKGLMKLIIYINNFFCVFCVGLLKDFLEINLNI